MIVALLAVGAALLVVPSVFRRYFDRIGAAASTRLATFALVCGGSSIAFGLVALALPSIGHTQIGRAHV